MSNTITVPVPDIGDFADVPVIEILVAEGEQVDAEQSLITLESDKATMEVPAPQAGKVVRVLVAIGDNLAEGSPIVELEVAQKTDPKSVPEGAPASSEKTDLKAAAAATQAAPASGRETDLQAQVVVLGSGPGGYTAAFRAADLGLKVVLIERYPSLGGVCLNVGCIPSKALLHTADVINQAAAMNDHGVSFGEPQVDLDKLRDWKNSVVKKLTQGLAAMAKQRKVTVVTGEGQFVSANEIMVQQDKGSMLIGFERAIIAAGSQSVRLPGLPWDDPRIMDSTDALELAEVPKRLLVIGGGIIGLEMASVFNALGSSITVCEFMPELMPGTDVDLLRPLKKIISKRYENIFLGSKVTKIEAKAGGLKAWFEGGKAPENDTFDKVLVAVGRAPNGNRIGADKAGVQVSDRGFIPVDNQMRSNVAHIFAIGDIVGNPMLAHKATHEAKVAAEVCAGEKSFFDALVIPSVAYTDPEVAWVGVTEIEAREQGMSYGKGVFPWAASGRALGLARSEGFTKLLFDEQTNHLIGAGVVGAHAGDLIAECALAIEMGSDAADLGLTIHPHPTLSETICFAAEAFEGTITDLYMPKKK
jgi:dihydrolipoamide dehydrogenase